ncbi:MAG TPA: CBS domain-containing protein [Methanothermococcus okinawensis]|uniref:CBS domain-containing protein n=1 Tax=Methanothermococcus okinawensis TaxID=155863 RepID=A0A833E562_9EURY|nr:CBS domain-containing protein [Methanococcaceae archaeon]HIP84624.1 CBS domain-containing protein [Methanothermococcus okinawensis]HIP91369.1 CBS domain-containing protein [Methanothermococcus okinawensis]
MTKVKDIMNRDFLTFSPDMIGGEAIELMYRRNKAYAPVVEEGKLEGWVRALDLMVGCKHSKLEDLMLYIDEVKVLKEDEEISEDLIEEMIKEEVIAYPVVNEDREVVGTLSVFDLLKYFKSPSY